MNILSKTLSNNQLQLNEALAYLEQISEHNFAWLVSAFVEIICTSKADSSYFLVPYKLQSVLQLKNLILKKSDAWLALPPHVKESVKLSVLSSFDLDDVRSIGLSQLVNTLAQVELPHSTWPELIPSLIQFGYSPGAKGGVSIQTVGYICESIDPDLLQVYNNQILTLLVSVLRNNGISVGTKIDSINALHSSLSFAESNFARRHERDQLMQIICECTQSTNIDLQVASLQCLNKAISLYYLLMEEYLPAILIHIACNLICSSEAEVVLLQSLEIINSVCDAEIKLMDEGDESTGWICPFLPQLVTCITQAFISAGPSVNLDWNMSQATQVTLGVISVAGGENIVRLMMNTLISNMKQADVMVHSCALACTSALIQANPYSQIEPLIQAFLDSTPTAIFHQSSKVRYHGGFTLSQVCQYDHEYLDQVSALSYIISIINKSLQLVLDNQVVEQCCWSLRYLVDNLQQRIQKYLASQYVDIINSLYQLTSLDSQNNSLERVSYETLNSCLEICPEECVGQLSSLLVLLLNKVQILPQNSPAMGYTCIAVASGISKISVDFLEDNCNMIFSMICHHLNCKEGSGMEEEFIAILCRLVERVPTHFHQNNINSLTLKLLELLDTTNHACVGSVGLISDVYRSCSDLTVKPDIDHLNVLQKLVHLVQHPDTDDGIKALAFGTISDIVLCIDALSINFYPPILDALFQTSQFVAKYPYDASHYENIIAKQLIKSIIETYSTLIQVLYQFDQFRQQVCNKDMDCLAQFILCLQQTVYADVEVLPVLCGVIGDIYKYLSGDGLEPRHHDHFKMLLQLGLHSNESKVRRIARWSQDQIPSESSFAVMKKARVEAEVDTGMDTSQSYNFRVSLSCSSSQYITQNIEESFTVNLSNLKSHNKCVQQQTDVNCNYVEATIQIPSHCQQTNSPSDCSFSVVNQLRKLGKRRAAAVFLESSDGKKYRDEDDDFM